MHACHQKIVMFLIITSCYHCISEIKQLSNYIYHTFSTLSVDIHRLRDYERQKQSS
jgi:hypothetical protein